MNNQLEKYKWINKKTPLSVLEIIVAVLVIVGLIFYFFKKQKKEAEKQVFPQKTIEKILKEDLTAPATGEDIKIPEETIKELTAPNQKETKEVPENVKIKEVPEDIIKNLTAP